MRILRWLVVIVVVVVIVVAAGAAYVYTTFDPNDHRERIVDAVKERTGRSLRLDAPMSLTFFPWFGVRLAEVTLESPDDFGDEPFFSAKRLGVRVEVLPLLDGQIVVDTLELEGVAVNLHRLPDGRDNWSDLVKKSGEARPEPASHSAAQDWIKGYAIKGVVLTEGKVQWRDDTAGATYLLEDIRLETGTIAPGKAVPLEGHLRYVAAGGATSGKLDMKGTLALSEDFQKLEMPDLDAAVDVAGQGLLAGAGKIRLAGGLVMDKGAGILRLDPLTVTGPGDLVLAGHMAAAIGEAPSYDGNFELQTFSPRALMSALGVASVKTDDPSVLGKASASFSVKGDTAHLAVDPLHLMVDDTNAKGRIEIALSGGSAVSFLLAADALNVDRYLPPATEKGKPEQTSGGAEADIGGIGAIALLDTKGSVSFGTLIIAGLTLTDTRVDVRTGGGKVTLDPMKAKLYGGSYNGNLKASASGKALRWQVSERLDGIQIGPLLTDLTGEDRLDGKGNLKADLSGVGLSDAAVRRSAEGKVAFDFRDGALKGINLAQTFREVKAKLKGQQLKEEGPLQTDFSTLQGSLQIADGEARNEDLLMKSPFLRVEGKGKAELVSEALDYLLTAKLVGTAKGQGGGDLADLEGIPLAVRVGGTFTEPTFKPDIEAMVRAAAGKRIDEEKAKLEKKAEERLDEEKAKLQEKTQDKLKKALKGLF